MQEPIHGNDTRTEPRIDEAALMEALAEPFDETEVKFKPQVVKGNSALVLVYVDARAIQDRLDDVLGTRNWQDDYECLADGSVLCRLKIRVGGEWLTKVDVGGPSEQPDGGDRVKAAFSDALKRAAVKFGIGRYLYRLPQFWCDFDPVKKKIAKLPRLPEWALPKRTRKMPEKPRTPPAKVTRASPNLPTTGEELQKRLYKYDDRLASEGLCQPGDLVKHVVKAGVSAGHDADLAGWSGAAILLAVEETRAFEAKLRQARSQQKEVA